MAPGHRTLNIFGSLYNFSPCTLNYNIAIITILLLNIVRKTKYQIPTYFNNMNKSPIIDNFFISYWGLKNLNPGLHGTRSRRACVI